MIRVFPQGRFAHTEFTPRLTVYALVVSTAGMIDSEAISLVDYIFIIANVITIGFGGYCVGRNAGIKSSKIIFMNVLDKELARVRHQLADSGNR